MAFLGLNLDTFKQLVSFAKLADGFTLAIAEVNFAADGDLVMQALRQHEIAQEVDLIELDLSANHDYSLFETLRCELAALKLDPQKNPVLLIRGLATAIGVKGNYTEFLNDLNFRRDVMAAEIPYPMVWFLPTYAINRLAKNAKDLWSWHSGLFEFRTTRETVVAAQTQMRQPTPGQLPDAKGSKQERIEQLERLLSEQSQDRKACIDIALELGSGYRGLSDYRQAKKYYRKALHWAEDEQDNLSKARGLEELGFIYHFDGESHEALLAYEQSLTLYRDVGARLGEANTLKAVGDVLQFLKRSQEALKHYEDALNLYRDVGARLGEANTLRAVGDVLQFLDRRQEALKHYEDALNLYRDVGARLGEANTLKAVGDVLQFLDRRQEALKHYEDALSLYRDVGARLGEANTLKAVGDVLQFLDRRQEALKHYEDALSLYRDVGARLGEANTLKAVGDVLQFLKRSQEALKHYEDALSLYRDVGDRLGEANTLRAVGDVLQFLDRRQEALKHYEDALSLYRDVGARLGEANTLRAVGDVLQFLDRRQEALKHYEDALSLYRDVGARLGEANVLQEFGKLQDSSFQSLQLLQQAQVLYEAIGDRYSQCRNLVRFIAKAQLALGNRTDALHALQCAADLASNTEFEFFREDALKQMATIQHDASPKGLSQLINKLRVVFGRLSHCFHSVVSFVTRKRRS